MKKSILLRRILIMVFLAAILTSILSIGLYFFVSREFIVDLKADTLLPTARAIAQIELDTTSLDSTTYSSQFHQLLNDNNKDFFDAYLFIYDSDKKCIVNGISASAKEKPIQTNAPPAETLTADNLNGLANDYSNQLEKHHFSLTVVSAAALETVQDTILTGREVTTTQKLYDNKQYLIVGVPIYEKGYSADDADSTSHILGSLIFLKGLQELSQDYNILYLTLIGSSIAAFFLLLVPAYLWSKKLVIPIHEMQEVSYGMSHGDFSLRADEKQPGELGDLAKAINEFARKSGQLEQTRRDYVANISHELRTPISSIRAMSETLKDGMVTDSEKIDRYYDSLIRESIRLSKLVDDLLELSRLQSGSVALQKTPMTLKDSIATIIDIYSEMADDTGVHMHLQTPLEDFPPVYSNADRVSQVMVVLLDNAIKNTPDDGSITITIADQGDFLSVYVSNTGPGISKDDMDHIFERFFKTDKSHSSGGTGLGLSIAYEIMHLLGENLSVESIPDQHTIFYFTLHKEP